MIQKLFFLFFLPCCFFLPACKNTQTAITENIYGKVVSITDGDTFTLLTDENEQIKIRLHGIDCPEKKQDFGQAAKVKLSELIFNKKVEIQKTDKDRYGRIVALVYDEEQNCINEEMLKAGLAWHFKKYDNKENWSELELIAKENRVGLWSHPNPIPPWNWRKKK